MIEIFSEQSFVDVLSFLFTLNTLFSFEKINSFIFSSSTKNKIEKCKKEFQILKTGVANSLTTECQRFFINEHIMNLGSLEKKINQFENKLKILSAIFRFVFIISAILSGITIFISNLPWIKGCYIYISLLLLFPTIFFFIVIAVSYLGFNKRANSILNDIKNASNGINDYFATLKP